MGKATPLMCILLSRVSSLMMPSLAIALEQIWYSLLVGVLSALARNVHYPQLMGRLYLKAGGGALLPVIKQAATPLMAELMRRRPFLAGLIRRRHL